MLIMHRVATTHTHTRQFVRLSWSVGALAVVVVPHVIVVVLLVIVVVVVVCCALHMKRVCDTQKIAVAFALA